MKKLFKPSDKPQRPYIKNALLFALLIGIFFTTDWLTKHFIFDYNFTTGESQNGTEPWVGVDWVVIGFRSLPHANTTFLSFINAEMPDWTYDLINMSLLGIFTISVFFSRHTLSVIGLSIITAGIMGNGFDMLRFDYVRDIIYTPWWDKGTFNFADMFIIVGAVITFVSMFMQLFDEVKHDKKAKTATV